MTKEFIHYLDLQRHFLIVHETLQFICFIFAQYPSIYTKKDIK